MRKFLLFILLTVVSFSIFAEGVKLYATPAGKKVVSTIAPGDRAVPIFVKGAWVKVGLAKDGKIGWVRKDDLYPKSSSLYIHVDKSKNDKLKITAYRDGQKLSSQESEKLYKQYKSRQLKQQQQIQHYFTEMNKMMEWNLHESERMFSHDFFDDGLLITTPDSVVIQESR